MLLTVDQLHAGYGAITILRDVSFAIEAGEIVTIVGANGAGKTTTLRAICGLLKDIKGSIRFNGELISGLESHVVARKGVVMIPEGRRLFPYLTVKDNLLMGSYRSEARAHAKRNLERVFQLFPRIQERSSQLAGSLSGGEQQMVAIARGMMADPQLLIFDEPSLGLSPLLVQQLFDIIRLINQEGVSILIVEQNVFQTLKLANRAYVLESGSIVMSGLSKDLLDDPHVKKAYLGI